MIRRPLLVSGLGLVASAAGCLLTTDLSGFSGGDDGGPIEAATPPTDAAPDVEADSGDAGASIDAGSDADASSCTCAPGLVSAYRFADAMNLGRDVLGNNDMTSVHGTPKQSTVTPSGIGNSIQLDGMSSVCIDSSFTFDSTSDHTLCWWSQPTALADSTNQFAQTCSYDTWTTSSGADYLWRINNCNSGTTADFTVPGVYTAGKWVQICQTYTRASMKRAVVIDGKTSQKFTITDSVPIVEPPSEPWCIGSYSGSGGFWTGYVYLPMWFDRVLGDAEIQQVNAMACCLP